MSRVIDVTLMGRTYRVACEPGEQEALMSAVAYVDAKMYELAGHSKIGGERLLAMTALNIAHDLILCQQVDGVDLGQVKRRVIAMRERIGMMLSKQSEASPEVEVG